MRLRGDQRAQIARDFNANSRHSEINPSFPIRLGGWFETCNTNRYTLHISTFILIFWAITQIEPLDIIHSSSLDLSCRTIYVIQELLLLVYLFYIFIIN